MSWPSSEPNELPSYNGIPYASQQQASLSFGPAFAGFMIQLFLYGIFMSLFLDYLHTRNYRRDRRANRALVWAIAGLHTLATGVNLWLSVYHGCNQDRGAVAIYHITLFDQIQTLIVAVVGSVVQAFLALRASHLFSSTRVVRVAFLAVTFTLIVVAFLSPIVMTVITYAYLRGWWARLLPLRYNTVAAVWLWSSAALDLALTATLILCLRRSLLGFNEQTDSAIRGMMRAALQSAVPTAIFAVAGALLNIAWGTEENSHAAVFQLAAFPLVSLYSLSLLTTLSSRKPIRRHKAVVGSSAWMRRSSDATAHGPEPQPQSQPRRPSLAARTISKMSIPTIGSAGKPPPLAEGAIRFTRDVVEQVELGEEPCPPAEALARPYLESYGFVE